VWGEVAKMPVGRIIHETIQPKPLEPKPIAADMERLLAWSEPVNGLAARIEYVFGGTVLVRRKNTAQRPIAVPAGNPKDTNLPQAFEIRRLSCLSVSFSFAFDLRAPKLQMRPTYVGF
jgi:hypothetical protein